MPKTEIQPTDILPSVAYAGAREDFRNELIAVKKVRRLHVGDKVTFLFENRKTVLYQIQEMCHAEKITTPAGIQQEIDVYSELLPKVDEISTTLLIEIPDQTIARAELDRLIGIDEHVSLRIGEHAVAGFFEPGYMTKERVSAVQYVRFRLTPKQLALFRGDATAAMAIDHPEYQATAELPEAVRRAIVADLEAAAG